MTLSCKYTDYKFIDYFNMVLSLERWKGKVAVVTGASHGIGAAVAIKLLEEGLIVAGLARSVDRIKALSDSTNLHAFQVDVRNEEEIVKTFDYIKTNLGPIHVVVNSAGINRLTTIIDGNSQFWKDTMDVNFMAMCVTIREAVRDMRANDVAGHLININSIGGHKVLNYPKSNVQPSSKFATTAMTEVVRQELITIGSKIKISDISPGLVTTNIFKAMVDESGGADESFESYLKFVSSCPVLDASDVADAVSYVLSTPPHCQVHELIIKPIGETF